MDYWNPLTSKYCTHVNAFTFSFPDYIYKLYVMCISFTYVRCISFLAESNCYRMLMYVICKDLIESQIALLKKCTIIIRLQISFIRSNIIETYCNFT